MRPSLLCSGVLAGLLAAGGCSRDGQLLFVTGGDSTGEAGGAANGGDGGDGASQPTGGMGAGQPTGGPGAGGAGAGQPTGGMGAGQPTGGTGAAGGDGKEYSVYASTDDTLYSLDPTAPELPLIELGNFECIDQANGPYTAMLDIAVDKFEHLWGITSQAVMPLYIGGGKVLCGTPVPLSNAAPGGFVPTFYALTFAPEGIFDPMQEVLVAGNSTGELWSIDGAGNVQKRGFFGTVPADDGNGHAYDPENVGKPWELSGDIVFLANDGEPVGFATVRDCPAPPSISGCSEVDTLIEIDMNKLKLPNPGVVTKAVRGKILKKIGCGAAGVVSGSMYGIAAWNEAVFGFSRSGGLVKILTDDAGGCLVKIYADQKFSGAGVSTLAPIEIPPLP